MNLSRYRYRKTEKCYRNFTPAEVNGSGNIPILDREVETTLLLENGDSLNKFVKIAANRYKVVGVLKNKGNSGSINGGLVRNADLFPGG